MIREATETDLLELVRLGRQYHGSTVFKDLAEYDEESAGMFFLSHIGNSNAFARVHEVDGRVVGYFLGIVAPVNFNNNRLIAQQVSWYVEPSQRGIRSIKVLKEWERWAKVKGAAIISNGRQSRMKKNRKSGYIELETVEIKGVK